VYHLAHLFLDYEPGIHYTQFQMQAGTTGVNTLRVYNPVKNALEHDPDAEFIKKWIPELSKLPTQLIAQPWLLNPLEAAMYQFKIGEDYPAPIIELQGKHKTMVDQIYAIKKTALAQTEGKTIVSKLVRPQKLKTKTAKKS
jgi:deoxyribodipyrimidine photo-lyase